MKIIKLALFLMLFLAFEQELTGQSLELFGGVNLNNFHEKQSDDGHYQSSYASDLGFVAGIGYDFKVDSFRMRMTLLYESYAGEVAASDGGNGGGYFIEADVKKSVIALGLYPLTLNITDRLSVNAGFEFSILTNEDFSGTYNRWTFGQPTITTDLEEEYDKFSSSLQYGIRLRIAYDIPLSSTLSLTPQYGLYYGLSNEFDEFPETTKSTRHYLMVGLKKII
jgi:hypothetical protein